MSKILIESIQKGDLSAVEKLLRSDSGLAETQMENGLSVLLLAIYHRQTAVVNLLLNYKKELSIFEAAALGHLEILQSKIKDNNIDSFSSDGFTPLGLACFFGHYPAAKWLLDQGAQVDLASKNSFRVRPLHSAAAIGRVDLVKLLLEHNAEVNATQQSGVTALHSAAHNNNIPLVQLLISQGADPGLTTEKGKTPLHMARDDGHTEVVRILSQKS